MVRKSMLEGLLILFYSVTFFELLYSHPVGPMSRAMIFTSFPSKQLQCISCVVLMINES